MDNPYRATVVEGGMDQKPFHIWVVSRFPFTLVSMVFSGLVIALYMYADCWCNDIDVFPKTLKIFLWPGVLPAYITVTLTNSMVIGWTSFVIGMITFYGIAGMVLDFFYWLSRRTGKADITDIGKLGE